MQGCGCLRHVLCRNGCTFLVSKSIGWDDRLSVTATDKNLVGHVGAVLLRKCADKAGLTSGLNAVIPRGEGPGWWDRGTVLTSLAVSIALGATSVSDIDLLAHQAPVFGDPPSDSTVRRCLTDLDQVTLGKIGKARAKARRRVWDLIPHRPTHTHLTSNNRLSEPERAFPGSRAIA
ncbi:hypothetical protein F8271_29690 [Micromonospora sp. ALFpr18c]|nr:hypothetical protein F8271_29690 [Micromonospora sp. ALFpr18c]